MIKIIKTKTLSELTDLGYAESEAFKCDCGCNRYRNEVACFASPNYVYIEGHQPSDATPYKDSKNPRPNK